MGNDGKRTVSFSFESEKEKQFFVEYARDKGLTLPALAKMALFQYEAKYPSKKLNRENLQVRQEVVRAVQPAQFYEGLEGSP